MQDRHKLSVALGNATATIRSMFESRHRDWDGHAILSIMCSSEDYLKGDQFPNQYGKFVQGHKCTLDKLIRVCLCIVVRLQCAAQTIRVQVLR